MKGTSLVWLVFALSHSVVQFVKSDSQQPSAFFQSAALSQEPSTSPPTGAIDPSLAPRVSPVQEPLTPSTETLNPFSVSSSEPETSTSPSIDTLEPSSVHSLAPSVSPSQEPATLSSTETLEPSSVPSSEPHVFKDIAVLDDDIISQPDYYDKLRTMAENLTLSVETGEGKSNVFRVTDLFNQTYRLAHLSFLYALSNGTHARSGLHEDAAGVLLAAYHFNNPDSSPLLNADVNPLLHDIVQNCNIRLTTEIFDSEMDPVHATEIITEVLKRERGIINDPQPTGVIGAFRSAVTSPLAILGGVSSIPMISGASTSTDFDDTEVYPLFARTCPSSVGDARAAVDYYFKLNVTHVAVLFITDSFGSATQKEFEDYARGLNITTASVAFPYSNQNETPAVIKTLIETKYRYIFVVCFEDQYDIIMQSFYDEKNAMNAINDIDQYAWLFYGMGKATFLERAMYPQYSALYNASAGIGIMIAEPNQTRRQYNLNEEMIEEITENSDDGHNRFRLSWRQFVDNPTLTRYFREKMPRGLMGMQGYDSNGGYIKDPPSFSLFNYDAVTTMGLAMCETDKEYFTGEDLFNNTIRNITFNGATGKVLLDRKGTRDFDTVTYTIWNAIPQEEVDTDGNNHFLLAPSYQRVNGQWKDVEEHKFVYADGTTTQPEVLPAVDRNENKLSNGSFIVGLLVSVLIMVFSVGCFLWTYFFRNDAVVCASQAPFLYLISTGCFIQSLNIVFLSLQEPIQHKFLDMACMASAWVLGLGLAITFAPLYAKTWILYQVFKNPELDRICLSAKDLQYWCGGMLFVNVFILTLWNVIAPMQYNIIEEDSTDEFGRSLSSYATCQREDNKDAIFRGMLILTNSAALLVANWWSLSARELETEYKENTYIGFALGFGVEALLVGFPIYYVSESSPSARHLVMVAVVALLSFAILLIVFVPKMRVIWRAPPEDRGKVHEEGSSVIKLRKKGEHKAEDYEQPSGIISIEINPDDSEHDSEELISGNETAQNETSHDVGVKVLRRSKGNQRLKGYVKTKTPTLSSS